MEGIRANVLSQRDLAILRPNNVERSADGIIIEEVI